MGKRFTETTKWDDPWFLRLPPEQKLLWLYICDRCDASGVIDFCPELASVYVGHTFTDNSLDIFGRRVNRLESGKWRIVKFLDFQYGKVDAKCPAHKPVIRLIHANGLEYPIDHSPARVVDTLSNRVSDNLKEKEKEKEGGTRGKPKDRQSVLDFVREQGLPETDGHYCFDHWESNGYRNGGKAILDWKATIRAWKHAGHLPSLNRKINPSLFKQPDPNQQRADDEYEAHRRRMAERKHA